MPCGRVCRPRLHPSHGRLLAFSESRPRRMSVSVSSLVRGAAAHGRGSITDAGGRLQSIHSAWYQHGSRRGSSYHGLLLGRLRYSKRRPPGCVGICCAVDIVDRAPHGHTRGLMLLSCPVFR